MTDRELLLESLPFLLNALSRAHSWAGDCAEWASTINEVHSKRLTALALEMAERHAEVTAMTEEFTQGGR